MAALETPQGRKGAGADVDKDRKQAQQPINFLHQTSPPHSRLVAKDIASNLSLRFRRVLYFQMGDKTLKLELEEGQVLDTPPSRVAPILANATPQERLAAVLRRIDTARTTYKLGAVELRPGSTTPRPVPPSLPTILTGQSTGPSTTRPAATYPDTMFNYPGPPRLPQNYTGGDTGYGNGNPPPGPSRAFQPSSSGRGVANGTGNPTLTPGPFPVVRGGDREGRSGGPVQQLSSECQRRRFNPEFKVTMQDGRYKCDVLVKTVVIQGFGRYDNPQEAKIHTALKALKTVQSWPLPRPAATAAPSVGRQWPQQLTKAETKKETPRLSEPSSTSGVDMNDPLQARAFVEGFRMGQLAAVSNDRSAEARPAGKENKRMSERSRSRSPRRHRRDSRHRSRSVRPYFDGSRHDPSLPSTDKYRPSGAASLRRDTGQLAKEDNYGRLKQDGY
ncbi:hypothetical protein N0V82_004863 [Gnomoniopsis sp. IMI 355080]|nr:hypothetical protein N0V82_004863 [Gnomoniopsis sp. IMI 355080]